MCCYTSVLTQILIRGMFFLLGQDSLFMYCQHYSIGLNPTLVKRLKRKSSCGFRLGSWVLNYRGLWMLLQTKISFTGPFQVLEMISFVVIPNWARIGSDMSWLFAWPNFYLIRNVDSGRLFSSITQGFPVE